MEVNYGGTEITCPGCGADSKFHPLAKRRAYVCQHCGHHIYPAAGTIFHKSRTNLTKWFFAMYLMTSTRHGVAAAEVQRQLGVTYKCAWRMCHELRKLMASADFGGPLGGDGKHVEIDETVMGGYQSNRERRTKGSNKSLVFGMVERDGKMRAGPIPNLSQDTLESIVRGHVKEGTRLTADEWDSYNDLKHGFDLGRVNHSKKQWVAGVHHTNTICDPRPAVKRGVINDLCSTKCLELGVMAPAIHSGLAPARHWDRMERRRDGTLNAND